MLSYVVLMSLLWIVSLAFLIDLPNATAYGNLNRLVPILLICGLRQQTEYIGEIV